MSTMKSDIKETIESSKSAEELLNNIDTLNPPIDEEELSNVAGGGSDCRCGACSNSKNACSTAKMIM